jgi:GxxExxY protein
LIDGHLPGVIEDYGPRKTRKEDKKTEKTSKGGTVDILFKEESYRVMGACFEVYQELGCGFLEAVYRESLEIEFGLQGIPFRPQAGLALSYKGRRLKQEYVPDFICYERIIVEIKALTDFDDAHRAQVHNYLKATGLRLGLLVNFGHHPKVQYERIVR